MNEELFNIIKEYIKNNLSIRIKKLPDGDYKVGLFLEDVEISYDYS